MGPIQDDRDGAMDTQGCERASLIALPLRSEVATKGTPPTPPWNRPPVVRSAVDEIFQNFMIAPVGPVCRLGYPLQWKTLSPTSTAIGGVPRTTKPVQVAPRYRSVYNWAQFDSAFMAAPEEDWESEDKCDISEHVGIPQQHWMGSEATEMQPSGIMIAMSPWGNPYPQTYRLHHGAPPQYSYPQANTSCHYPATRQLGYGDSPMDSPTFHRREPTTYATTEAAMSYPRARRGATSYVTHTNEAVSTAEGSEEGTYGAVGGAYRWQAGGWAEESPSQGDQWVADRYQ
ncbi:hypothetical protein PTI98_007298 [Pleurotus ostreatus]|nr:hypothetical protein PTI98_007298 [Pleurotus ostreatus]